MISLDRVLCDCCGDDMGQVLGGVVVAPGHICDHSKAPHFAICPECVGDGCDFLGLHPSELAA